MLRIKQSYNRVSIKLKNQLGFTLIELVLVLAVIAILSSIAVPKFFDFSEKANEKLLNAALAELNGREKLAFAKTKNSTDGWVNDAILFSQVNTDINSDFHWGSKAKKTGGTLHLGGQKIKLERICSTNTSAGKWIIKE